MLGEQLHIFMRHQQLIKVKLILPHDLPLLQAVIKLCLQHIEVTSIRVKLSKLIIHSIEQRTQVYCITLPEAALFIGRCSRYNLVPRRLVTRLNIVFEFSLLCVVNLT